MNSQQTSSAEKQKISKKKKKPRCLNKACKSFNNLVDANHLDHALYDIKDPKDFNKVCVVCKEYSEKHFEELETKFNNNESIFNYVTRDCEEVITLDSEESEDEEIVISDEDEVPEVLYDEATLELINKEIDNFIALTINKGPVNTYGEECFNIINESVNRLTVDMEQFEKEANATQKQLDEIRRGFYSHFPLQEFQNLPDLDIVESDEEVASNKDDSLPSSSADNYEDAFRRQQIQQHETILKRSLTNQKSPRNASDDVLVEERSASVRPTNVPRMAPFGQPLVSPPIKLRSEVWVMRNSCLWSWGRGTVLEILNDPKAQSPKMYKVKVGTEKKARTVHGKHLAHPIPYEFMYRVGMRVISMFNNSLYYSGIVAEIPKETNKWRYLIFFDDGYTAYSTHSKTLIIYEPSKETTEDVPEVLRDFFKEYLSNYPERAMVKMNVGDKISTLYKNKWINAEVLEIDCSLAKMRFSDKDDDCDWVFRGSDRLRPLYESKVNAARRCMELEKNNSRRNITTENFVVPIDRPKVQTARKSLSGKNRPRVYFESGDKKLTWNPVKVPGKIVYRNIENVTRGKKYEQHTCSRQCVNWIQFNFDVMIKKIPLLAIPLYTGCERIVAYYKGRKVIFYSMPCGRKIRSSAELGEYLRHTRSKWTVDMFEFDTFVDVLREFVIDSANITIKDISNGRENVPISCVNYIDTDVPKTVDYMTERKPKEGVTLNTDPEFMICCSCTDNCKDKKKCECWQLTIKANQDLLGNRSNAKEYIGYQNKRLPDHVVSGIYECNRRCSCSRSCYNRVVQFPLVQKLQLFKTEMKGWGLRCLTDIPQGSFICIYAGHLLTDNDANEEGKNYGDEYLAELDFIECIERTKEGYESDVPEDSDSSNEGTTSGTLDENSMDSDVQGILNSEDENDTEHVGPRLRKRKKNKDGERKTSSLMMTLNAKKKQNNKKPEIRKSLREYFGENENVYIMDARTSGNIGRYLNHSCSPNVFVQNVFVDTHDPRFPWVSFFALKYIEAGTELTWDYAYDIGSVPGKVVYCYCGSPECRHRLL